MDRKDIRRLRGEAQSLKATVQVGKEGMTPELVAELLRQLKREGLVKVRLLPSLEMDREAAGDEMARLTSSVLVEVRGRTAVLAREQSLKQKQDTSRMR